MTSAAARWKESVHGVDGAGPPRAPVARWTLLAVAALVASSWLFVVLAPGTNASTASSAWSRALDFLGALLGRRTPLSPAGDARGFLSLARWVELAHLGYETLAMSVLAIWISMFGMLLTVMAGARPKREADGAPRAGPLRWAAFYAVRGAWVVARAVPELLWALLIVLVFRPGVLAGALALGLHNFGIVGKLCAEVVEDLDPGPARALRAGGASAAQTLAFAVFPQALPQFLTYGLYRWEVVIRTTIVVGFVSASGLGREFRLAMSFFHFTDVTMVLVTYFALVALVDLFSGGVRRLAR